MAEGHIVIETPRLRLRHWLESDLPAFIAMNADPEVMRYFPETLAQADSRSLYGRIQQEFAERGYGPYAVEEKNSGTFIGFIGFHWADFSAYFCPGLEILWRLNQAFWNRGYATEGAAACLAYGSGQLNIERVYSFTAVENLPSQRMMQKIGMRLDGYFEHPELPEGHPLRPHVCYAVGKEAGDFLY